MVDRLDAEQRSRLMARIKSRGNYSTELKLVALLRKERIFGWRRQVKLPGTPDFVFKKERICVFVHGCFWHGCVRCKKQSLSHRGYWREKIDANRQRDRRVARELRRRGYAVIIVWECSLRGSRAASVLGRISRTIAFRTKSADNLKYLKMRA